MQLGNSEKSINPRRKQQIEEAIRRYSDMIFRIAYNYLRNFHDAQDILQEVGVAMVKGRVPLDDNEYLRNWLCRVTVNKCKNFRKSSALRMTEPLTDDIAYTEQEPSELIAQLWKLPKNYRNVLYLFYYEDFSIEEISEILGKSKNTIGSQLRRGREKLKKILTEGGYYIV